MNTPYDVPLDHFSVEMNVVINPPQLNSRIQRTAPYLKEQLQKLKDQTQAQAETDENAEVIISDDEDTQSTSSSASGISSTSTLTAKTTKSDREEQARLLLQGPDPPRCEYTKEYMILLANQVAMRVNIKEFESIWTKTTTPFEMSTLLLLKGH